MVGEAGPLEGMMEEEGGLLTEEGSTVVPDRFIIEERIRSWYSSRRFDCGPWLDACLGDATG